MNKRLQTVLEVVGIALAMVIVCAIVYGSWQLGRHINYSLSYEDMVRKTVCEMVKPEHLKDSKQCEKAK